MRLLIVILQDSDQDLKAVAKRQAQRKDYGFHCYTVHYGIPLKIMPGIPFYWGGNAYTVNTGIDIFSSFFILLC